jgi:hypothetical protein
MATSYADNNSGGVHMDDDGYDVESSDRKEMDIDLEPTPCCTAMTMTPISDDDIDNPEKMERMWAKELYEMKPEEREAANNELHGVEFASNAYYNNNVKTTTECLEQRTFALNAMQDVLDELVPPSSIASLQINNSGCNYKAYLRGLITGSVYIRSPEFRLRFLRADRFDPRKAALRYCNCLDLLVEYFGEKVLYRSLYLSDLNYIELKSLREGHVQIMPSRDRNGRRILVFAGKPLVETDEHYFSLNKVMMYLLMGVLANDVTTQCKGAVVLIFPANHMDARRSMDRRDAFMLNKFINYIPLRWSAMHFCIPDEPVNRIVLTLSLALIGPAGRKICRLHNGSLIECDYALSSYGIMVKDIPWTYTGTIKIKNLSRFIKARSAIDDYRKKAAEGGLINTEEYDACGVECPEVNCVLFGNKAQSWDHPGNIEFRDVILEKEKERDRFPRSCLKGDKYVDSMIQEGILRNFHFCDYDKKKSWYTEINNMEILRHKITQLLTGIRKRQKVTKKIHDIRREVQVESPDGVCGCFFSQ